MTGSLHQMLAFRAPAFGIHSRENPGMTLEFTASYVNDSMDLLRYYKRLGERAIEQAPDNALCATLDSESNSIATIVKHRAGNMRSRWTDFLTSDGEKPDRNRDTEFETAPKTRTGILAVWEAGWKVVFEALTPLTSGVRQRGGVFIRRSSGCGNT
jgi:hypothetical protein